MSNPKAAKAVQDKLNKLNPNKAQGPDQVPPPPPPGIEGAKQTIGYAS